MVDEVNVVVGTVMVAWLLAFCVFVWFDVAEECRFQTEAAEHDELLDLLWDDEDGSPGAVNLEAVQTTEGMGSS